MYWKRCDMMTNEKKIHLLIDNNARLSFFSRVLQNENIKPIVVYHSNLYTWLKAKLIDFPGKQLLLSRKETCSTRKRKSIEEVKSGRTIKYSINASTIEKATNNDILWVFSGFQFSALELSKLYNTVRYFEIANFPNKYQSSYAGVNADSDYTTTIIKLNNSENISQSEIKELKESLINFRPKHVDSSILGKAFEQTTNLFGFYFFKTLAPHDSPFRQIKTALDIYQVRKAIKSYYRPVFPNQYNLFIGQVAHDSQTVFQSETDPIAAIHLAFEQSKRQRIPLVVRLHPGEKSLASLRKQIDFCEKNNIIICNNGSLLNAVNSSNEVFTINSTGGLQSLLFEKKVTTYGRAFYSGWSSKDVALYHKYILKDLNNKDIKFEHR